MDKKFYKEKPRIPSVVYKSLPLRSYMMWGALIGLGSIVISIYDDEFYGYVAIYVFLCFGLWFEFRKSVKDVYINETTVTARFNNGHSIVNAPLEDFVILVKSAGKGSTKNYRYDVCLAHKKNILGEGRTVIFNALKSNDHKKIVVPLVLGVLCPKNLREWIEAFQSQVRYPLDMAFGEKRLIKDFETGEYMSYDGE